MRPYHVLHNAPDACTKMSSEDIYFTRLTLVAPKAHTRNDDWLLKLQKLKHSQRDARMHSSLGHIAEHGGLHIAG